MARLAPKIRKEQLLSHAVTVATKEGFEKFTRRQVAQKADVSDSLISLHWGTMPQLRRSVMRHAVQHENLQLIAQGLCARDSVAMKAPQELKERAARLLAR